MAGVTDAPMRRLCRRYGAGLAASEMANAEPRFRCGAARKLDLSTDVFPRVVQIAGSDPQMMADWARDVRDRGADIVDINMGCPAKKVCNAAAGSALLRDEALVERILTAVVVAVDVPVTLKIRTGWSPETRNALTIARMAEDLGVQALTIHGRTRACRFNGTAEHATTTAVVASVAIPVIANGDIRDAETAARVLHDTGAAAVMIGRGAQSRPWLFDQVRERVETGTTPPPPSVGARAAVMLEHVQGVHEWYGLELGARLVRKTVRGYLADLPGGNAAWLAVQTETCAQRQYRRLEAYVQTLSEDEDCRQAA